MPFERPTLATLVSRVRSDLRGRLSLSGSLLRRAVVDVLGAVWGGAVHMLHGHLDWAAKQLFADTAEEEIVLREATMRGLSLIPATFAAGTVLATGVNTSVIPVDTILVRTDGAEFRVTVEATIAGGEADVAVEAVVAGDDGNAEVGEVLSFESPITGVDSTATVEEFDDVEGIVGGVDEEEIDTGLRQRLLDLKRSPPEGGNDADYIAWAKEIAGVTRAWVYRHENGLGTVVVRFVMDEEEASIFPGPSTVADVQDKLDSERPTTAEVTAAAPDELRVDFTLAITPDTSAVRAAVAAELADLFFREGEPGDGDTDRGFVLLSKIRTAIGNATGLEDYTLTTPAADVEPALGELAVLGDITWV